MQLSFSNAVRKVVALLVVTLAGAYALAAQTSSPSAPPATNDNSSTMVDLAGHDEGDRRAMRNLTGHAGNDQRMSRGWSVRRGGLRMTADAAACDQREG